ncbi:hypothetical protein TRFO_14790 [Tritrichomonas foetus]|uniref:UDENN domain-containing protein n=1 Tax=Tritrichomonas foetus TaxID=1144522 RepID=A0A1J4KYQ5_9EUKA|nr:hypothetical protein TRFO_14790 [Tritrichomonas foetus]|eukprot:OHT14836.1 hypothetical protein TRFO_14790 [Tritrichomonas foetus]
MQCQSLCESLSQFTANDGSKWSKWDRSNNILDSVFIIGPTSFDEKDEFDISMLYEYPNDNINDLSIKHFIYEDKLSFPDLNIQNQCILEAHFCSENDVIDESVFMHNESGNPKYIYCIRFSASPLTRPAQLNNENVFLELEDFRKQTVLPIRLFCLCLISSHPFCNFYFQIMRRILQLEAKARTSAQNIYMTSCAYKVVNHHLLWPNSSFLIREQFLNLIRNSFFPFHSEKLVLFSSGLDVIEFKMPSSEDVNHMISLWSFSPLLEWISIKDFVLLLTVLLLEQYIVVIGQNFGDIVKTVSFLSQLIHPFTWICPTISLLPKKLFDVMESPMANIIGLFAKYKNKIPDNYVILNLDDHSLFVPKSFPSIPNLDIFISMIDPLFTARKTELITQNLALTIFRIINDFIESIFTNHIVKSILTKVGNNSYEGSMFIPNIYFGGFNQGDHEFVRQLTSTQYFSAYIEQCCIKKTQIHQNLEDSYSLETFDGWLKFRKYKNTNVMRDKTF